MRYRFTLSHDTEGSLQISEPDGWRDASLKMERHPDFHSLVEQFEGAFMFYGSNGSENGGISFIKQIEDTYGVDAELNITIEIADDDITYETIFFGQLDLSTLEEMPDNKLKCSIVPDSFWMKFITRFDTPVDIRATESIDGDTITVPDNVNLNTLSQKIRSSLFGRQTYSVAFENLSSSSYAQVDWDNIDLNEIEDKFSLPIFGNSEIPVWLFDFKYGGDYNFEISIPFTRGHVQFGETIDASFENVDGWIDLYIQFNEDDPILFSELNGTTSYGDSYTVFTYSDTVTLAAGTIVRIYADLLQTMNRGSDGLVLLGNYAVGDTSDTWEGTAFTFDFNYLAWVDEDVDNTISVIADTEYDDTNSEGFLLHDVGAQISDRIISQDSSFYSEFLGSTQTLARTYLDDGCGWKYILVKGLQLRQYSLIEKPFFLSMKDWWEGINPILNLSLSYEDDLIRVEQKEYQYDNSSNSVEFDNIRDITRVYDNQLHFNKIDIGYQKWQSEDISGIDDPQTKHTYASIFKKVGTTLQLFSSFIAASLSIEITRRNTREKSADYKHDNETFIIAINPDPADISPETSPDVTDYIPELDENFTVSNLLNSDTRYNIRLTPKRNLTHWMNFIAMGLFKYASSALKFVKGEGNYDTSTTISESPDCGEVDTELVESDDLPITGYDTLFVPEVYRMTLPMNWEAYQAIKNNKKNSIGISQTDEDHTQFFIKTLEFNPFSGQAVVNAWPKTHMDLEIIDVTILRADCVATFRITEAEEFRITEDGKFRII